MRSTIVLLAFLTVGCPSLYACQEYEIISTVELWSEYPNNVPLGNTYVVDEFAHPTLPPVDVFFAIDKSGSMIDNRNELIANIPDFVNILDKNYIDYHIGITSTDARDPDTAGKLSTWNGVRWVSPSDFDPVGTFSALEAAATGGGEAGIDAVSYALTDRREVENKGFFRYGAPLHIITISDEPDQSNDFLPRNLVRIVEKYKINYNTFVTYSAIVHLYSSLICPANEYNIGSGYIRTRNRIGGHLIDICKPDWSYPIQVIADRIGQEVDYEYFLTDIPSQETIKVFVIENGVTFEFYSTEDLPEGELTVRGFAKEWYYDELRNSIVFAEFIPEYDTAVRVEYCSAGNYNEDMVCEK